MELNNIDSTKFDDDMDNDEDWSTTGKIQINFADMDLISISRDIEHDIDILKISKKSWIGLPPTKISS